MLKKHIKRCRRHKRVRSKIIGDKNRPRLCVFRSSNHVYAQLIDDESGNTLVSVGFKDLPKKEKSINEEGKSLTGKIAKSYELGKLIAKKAIEKKIEKVVFDRGGYKYHGRVKALAEGAREQGLKF